MSLVGIATKQLDIHIYYIWFTRKMKGLTAELPFCDKYSLRILLKNAAHRTCFFFKKKSILHLKNKYLAKYNHHH